MDEIKEAKKLDTYDLMIILQAEYNKLTGEELEKDVAFSLVDAIKQYLVGGKNENKG